MLLVLSGTNTEIESTTVIEKNDMSNAMMHSCATPPYFRYSVALYYVNVVVKYHE